MEESKEKKNSSSQESSSSSSSGGGDFGKMFKEPKENIFLSEEQQIETYKLEKSGKSLQIQSRKVNNGISRVVWKASLVMAQYIENVRYKVANQKGQDALKFLATGADTSEFRILELGSGTGCGGLFT